MRKIAVLLGGDSPEREVSLVSGRSVAEALRSRACEAKEIDPAEFSDLRGLLGELESYGPEAVFIALHGGTGENGKLQAALSLAGFRHTGSGFEACAMTMDKYVSKLLALAEGVPAPEHIILREDLLNDYADPGDYSQIVKTLGLPLIVKPNDGGSSVGITKVEEIASLKPAVKEALRYSPAALLERFVPGRELTVTVLDGKALPVVEIRPHKGWYDYENKYNAGRSEYLAPAPLEESVAQLLQLYAERLWKVYGLAGYARVDFRYDGDKPYFLEVNTLPGMTPLSLTPMAAKAVGLEFPDLVQKIIQLATR